MFQRILVAIDKSDISLQALERAIALAKLSGANMKLVHVLDDRDPENPPFPYISELQSYTDLSSTILDAYQREYQTFIDHSWQWLEWHGQEALATGVNVEWNQTSGAPGRTLCEEAEAWQADLIIIGSRCLSGLSELLLGSVSNYVVHHAPCSVCVIHPQLSQNPKSGDTTLTQTSIPPETVSV